MLAGKKDANSYIAEMTSETRRLAVGGDDPIDIDQAVADLVAEIEAEFTQERLNEYVRTGGFTPTENNEVPT